ncbi:MAG TPA: hypothetical protein VGX23_35065 [Actinocrinis sp.]|nr:hypothetical protein [Actinocrinis sp.]
MSVDLARLGSAGRGPAAAGPAAGRPEPTEAEQILDRQEQRESSARTYARHLPVVPVCAEGMVVHGADGREYPDCLAGAGTLALGHNHPVALAQRVRSAALDRGPLVELGGRHGAVLRLLPPLTITDQRADRMVSTLVDAIAEACREWRTR